ncbi:histidine phosphatase family protein [Sphingopyxis granuli]|uniref:histidine phosphatase family protein n=1 Tax=Sphingopyxis granuli TaxID=267128 RepID=UPI001FD1705C|nr:histidine phosphatase family protein [Sphingopyxis granuli]
MTPRWPSILWVVRYGQSSGNVARDAADAAGDLRIALDHRDVDVPLSRLGEEQSRALGEWFAEGQEGCAASDPARKAPPSGGAFPGPEAYRYALEAPLERSRVARNA